MRPDRCCRTRKFSVIQCACPHEDEMRPRFGLAEKMGTAYGTKTPVHYVPTIRDAHEVTRLARDCHPGRRKTYAYSSIPGCDVLANAAPAKPGCDGWINGLVTHTATEAAA